MTSEAAKQRRREANRIRVARRRREAGAKPREQYIAESVAEHCRLIGISRQTYYRRIRREKELKAMTKTTTTTTAARPSGIRAVTSEAVEAARRAPPSWQIAAVRAARACIAAGIDPVDETDENIVFPDGPEAA